MRPRVRRLPRLGAVLSLAVALLVPALAAGQQGGSAKPGDPPGTVTADLLKSLFKVDVNIPDVPAGTVIGVDPSKAGTPATVRALALQFSGFSDSAGRFRLPRTFATEFAPRLLFAGRGLNVTTFRRQLPLSSLRFSAATSRVGDTTGATQIAVGVRTNFIDRADPRSNRAYQDAISELLVRHSVRMAALREYVLGDTTVDRIEDVLSPAAVPPTPSASQTLRCAVTRAGADSLTCEMRPVPARAQQADPRLQSLQRAVTATLDSLNALKKDFEARRWNALRLEAAYALGGRTADAAGRSPRAEAHGVWAGLTMPINRFSGANLVARQEWVRDTLQAGRPFDRQVVGAGRLLLGSNRARVFGEYQYTRRGDQVGRVYTGGGELRLTSDVWLRLAAGREQQVGTAKGRLVTVFKLIGAPQMVESSASEAPARRTAAAGAQAPR